jgi:GntR family transcriptional repressor for pyruvate dehydrogenase complex
LIEHVQSRSTLADPAEEAQLRLIELESTRPGAIQKIERTNLPQRVLNSLIELMVQGHLKPGDKLPSEKELMDSLGVGRSTVRSALQTLSFMGLVEGGPGKGTFISNNTSEFLASQTAWVSLIGYKDALQVLEARGEVEGGVVALAAARATPTQRRELEVLVARMRAHVADPGELQAIDHRLHRLMSIAAQNLVLLRFVHSLTVLMPTMCSPALFWQADPEDAVAEHEAVVRAVVAGDAEAARRAVKVHTERSIKRLKRAMLASDGGQPSASGEEP